MPKLVIATEDMKSRSLKALSKRLSEELGYRVYRVLPNRVRARVSVRFPAGVDKRDQLRAFHENGIPAPAYALARHEAQEFPPGLIVIRQLTNAHSGRGITIHDRGDDDYIPDAPLYTLYIKKKKEFRVHVWNNKVIDVQQKKKRAGQTPVDTQVRNHANGYVYCRDNIVVPDDLYGVALAAVAAIGRTNGAVDVIWNEKQNKSYVLEVNSRPGLEGTTLDKYTQAIVNSLQ
jgi:carbamoylphosphate synthase large subunit